MQTYISMLRGINVSGSKKIKMVELKALYEKLKFKEVETFIQSGNVIFKSNRSESAIIKTIYDGLQAEWDYDVTIVLKTPTALQKVISNNPFQKNRHEDPKKLHVTFLAKLPDKKLCADLIGFDSNNEEFIIQNKEIYVFCPDGYGSTKLHNNFFERKLKVGATTRNWNSLNRMYHKSIS